MNLDSPRRRAARGPRPARLALRTQQREQVRAQILAAAEELIAANGLHGAALAQIARRAGVAVGTLYNYFTDRDDLVRALFDTRRAALRPQLLALGTAGKALAFEARLRQFVRDLLDVYETNRQFIKVAIETEHVKVTQSTTVQDLQLAIDKIVAAGVSEGVVAGERAALLSLLVAGGIRAVVLRRTADGGTFVRDADAIVSIFLDGARAR